MKTANPTVVAVLGSLNVDWVAAVSRLPAAGETVSAIGLRKLHGGKGANQAMAAARAGARVRFLGCVGGDADGAAYRSRLEEAGIDTTGLVTVKRSLTGTALIGVDAGGENLIMVAPEANGKVSSTQIRRHRTLIESAGVLLMQFEVPEAAVLEAGRIANRARVPVVINPSPFSETFPWGRIRIDCVIANETEAFRLFGMRAGSIRRSKGRWISAMNARGIDSIVLTRGSASTWHLTACGGLTEVATRAVRPVDTVGAGDAFAGAYVAFRTAGESLVRSLQAGNCCGALATLKAGAQEALPTRQELLRAMQSPAG